jgi:hypothetical protein
LYGAVKFLSINPRIIKRLLQRRAFGIVLLLSIVTVGFFGIAAASRPIRLSVARYELDRDESPFAIIQVKNQSRYCYSFRFKRNNPDVPCIYDQTATGRTQWVGNATLERAGGAWPRPILAGETIFLRLRLPTNGPVVAKFELQPVKTVDDIDSIIWDLRKAGEDFGILSEKLVVRTERMAAP